MALPKKKSRVILIDTVKYRWVVGPNDGYNVFVAEKEECKGRRIEVYFTTDINAYWVGFPNVDNLNLRVLKPKDAELIIRQALKLGWNTDEKGSPIIYNLVNDKIIKREKAG